MLILCQICDEPIKDGERVRVTVTSTYHLLKSTVAYALDKNDLEADGESLRHESCDRSLPA